ncbi:MAG: hypothetical protein QOJ50_509 [Cryptosporangiaceae bacterium]|nr:hypothetical protein [Cryptosporangiaceae bacterium]
MSERRVWAIRVLVEATAADAGLAMEAIERALCPDDNHPGECPVPWFLTSCDFGELDDDERAWEADFAADRPPPPPTEPPAARPPAGS